MLREGHCERGLRLFTFSGILLVILISIDFARREEAQKIDDQLWPSMEVLKWMSVPICCGWFENRNRTAEAPVEAKSLSSEQSPVKIEY